MHASSDRRDFIKRLSIVNLKRTLLILVMVFTGNGYSLPADPGDLSSSSSSSSSSSGSDSDAVCSTLPSLPTAADEHDSGGYAQASSSGVFISSDYYQVKTGNLVHFYHKKLPSPPELHTSLNPIPIESLSICSFNTQACLGNTVLA